MPGLRKKKRRCLNKPDKYTVVVTCVVMRRSSKNGLTKALILQRSEKEEEGPGLWTIPGGKMQVSDWGSRVRVSELSHKLWMGVLRRAVLREIREETGLKPAELSLPHIFGDRDKVFIRQDGTPALVVVFLAEARNVSHKITIGDDLTDYRWVTEKELKRYRFIGNVKDDIRRAFKGPLTPNKH